MVGNNGVQEYPGILPTKVADPYFYWVVDPGFNIPICVDRLQEALRALRAGRQIIYNGTDRQTREFL